MRTTLPISTLAALIFALSAFPAEAGWIAHGRFGNPAGIKVGRDRVLAFAGDWVVEFAPDGTMRNSWMLEAEKSDEQGFHADRVATAADGFIATGAYTSENRHYPAIVRVNAEGTVLWARSVEANHLTDMTVADETPDGDIVMATRTFRAMLVIRFTASGETKWSRVLDRSDVEDIKALVATRDGGVLAITTALTRYAALTRIDRDGRIEWDRVLGSADAGYGFYSAVELADGSFIAAGRMRILNSSNREGWLMRISARGEVIWQKTVGADGEEGLFTITQLGPNEFAAVGGTTSAGTGDVDTWIVTFNADGVVTGEIAVGKSGTNDGPQDPHRSFASALDGDVVFVSPTETALMVGRIRLASTACDATRAIRTRQRDSTATHHGEAELLQSDFKAVIKPIAISTRSDRRKTELLCRWAATADVPVAPQVIGVQPADEESMFADQIATLLIGRRFEELERTAKAAGDQRSTFESGRSKLRAFHEALGRHASLSALGDEKHRQLLDEWRSTTNSATSGIALASYYSAAAERVRGGGFFDTLLQKDADRYQELTRSAIELLMEAEQAERCDAPCYDLWIRTAKLGGWSEPMKKLIALDPKYWEAFSSATRYLGENWGGSREAIAEFVESAAGKTKDVLGDALYAFHYAGWRFGVIYVDRPAPPPPDWSRMRKGFADFQRLHPQSRSNAQLFAAAAYRVARDRKTARSLFASPMVSWNAGVWTDHAEYQRAKDWALREPVENFAAQLSEIKGTWPRKFPRVVAWAEASSAGHLSRSHAFLLERPAGPIGWIVAGDVSAATNWLLDGNTPLPGDSIARRPHMASATFAPPPVFAKAMHALEMSSTPVAIGDRLFIVACSQGKTPCTPHVIAVRATTASIGFGSYTIRSDEAIDWKQLAGAPVLNDDGAVTGILIPTSTGKEQAVGAIQFLVP